MNSPYCAEVNAKESHSSWRTVFFELLEVAVFDLFHEGFSAEEVRPEIGSELPGHDGQLVVDHFRERNGATCRDEMQTPL